MMQTPPMPIPPWVPPELAPEEISKKRFRISWRGFDRDEVGQFLAQVAMSYDATLAQANEAAVLRLRLSQAERALQEASGMGWS